jgi:hypothetical protein
MLSKESLGHHERRVWVSQQHKMRHLGESVDHGQNHGLAAYARKAFDEIHGDVAPTRRRNVEWLEAATRV